MVSVSTLLPDWSGPITGQARAVSAVLLGERNFVETSRYKDEHLPEVCAQTAMSHISFVHQMGLAFQRQIEENQRLKDEVEHLKANMYNDENPAYRRQLVSETAEGIEIAFIRAASSGAITINKPDDCTFAKIFPEVMEEAEKYDADIAAAAAAAEAERSEPREMEGETENVEEEEEEEEDEDDDDERLHEGGDGEGMEERNNRSEGDQGKQGDDADRAVKNPSSPLTMKNLERWLLETPTIPSTLPATEAGRSEVTPIDQHSSADDSASPGYSMSSLSSSTSSTSTSSDEEGGEPEKKKTKTE